MINVIQNVKSRDVARNSAQLISSTAKQYCKDATVKVIDNRAKGERWGVALSFSHTLKLNK
jgi:hypothetical protein